MKKIDIFPHIFPKEYYEKMVQISPSRDALRRWLMLPVLHDLPARLRMMEEFGDDYQQVLTLSLPTIEFLAPPDRSAALARLGNDGMAEICAKYPERFPGWVASLPMNNVPAALEELTRVMETAGARGIQLFTNVEGKALDSPEFAPIFERMHHYDMPIWLHPTRRPNFADYATEKSSQYELWSVFGWPYETSIAMGRMVFSGFFDRWPNLKVITHHLGAMVPFLESRVGYAFDELGTREGSAEHYKQIVADMKKKGRRPLDYFRMFYGDTAIEGSRAGTRCGIEFFGCDHVLFGTDCPFDPEGGPLFIRKIIETLDTLEITEDERRKIYNTNARRLLRLP
jgi:predicted TIM-barrel fold metal-dependent hydrolase